MQNSVKWEQVEPLLWQGIRSNVLPILSSCPLQCLFCSNMYNPPGTLTYSIPPLPLGLLEQMIAFLDPEEKIIIGESATRIREGEPFSHPQFLTLLSILRKKHPSTSLQITTSAVCLNKENIKQLPGLAPLELVLSLNCISPQKRSYLMGPKAGDVHEVLDALFQKGIPFHGSMVAMPHLVGWEELEKTLLFLDNAGAVTIRVFLPGFTRAAQDFLHYPSAKENMLISFLKRKSSSLKAPVTLEPSRLHNLEAEVAGVYPFSPAERAGLQRGDIILEVQGSKVFSRVHAFSLLKKEDTPLVKYLQGDMVLEKKLLKQDNQSPGTIFEYDFEPHDLHNINKIIKQISSQSPLLLTSRAAFPLWGLAEVKRALPSSLQVEEVPCLFFGGNINCAGLLTVSDFRTVLAQKGQLHNDLIILPAIAFDPAGKDMRGRSYLKLQEEVGKKVVLV